MAKMLPVVLRGHHILPGKQREESPAKWNQSSELQPADRPQQTSPGDGTQDLGNSTKHTSAGDHNSHLSVLRSENDGTSTLVRKYGPLVGPLPAPAPEETIYKVPVTLSVDDRKGKVWDHAHRTTYHQRDLNSSDTQGLTERQHGFTSSFSYIKQSRNSQSFRDLTALRDPPAVEGLSRPLNGVIFSTDTLQRGLGYTKTLQLPRKTRPNSERIGILAHNQTWVQYRLTKDREPQRRGAGCSRKVVRNQIKRVVDNLEQVLTALRDVHQEMREVVQQIDYLTSSIDLNEDEQPATAEGDGVKPPSDSKSSSGSSSSEATVGSTHQRPSELEERPGLADSSGTLRRVYHCRSQSPPNMLMGSVTFGLSSDRSRNLRFTSGLVCSSNSDNLPLSSPPRLQDPTSRDVTLSPQRSLPVRPPTPGLSPLTINLHHSNSPGSRPHSPGPSSFNPASPPSPLSPKLEPPPSLCPSVIIETKIGSYQTPQSDHPSAGQLSSSSTQPSSASCPPTDSEAASRSDRDRRASSAGPSHRPPQVCSAPAAAARPLTAQSRRGRKPPPYPHHRSSEHTKKATEPRKAPPYPEKRRLLSTTV
ncbi:uncharacterized protein V6R79_001207 [Siganus canaliculatus]